MERRFQERETDETAEWMLVRWSGHCRGPHWGVGVGESRGGGACEQRSSALGHRVSGGKRRVRRLPQLAQVKWSLQGVRRGLDKIDGLGRGGDGGQGGLQVYRKMLDTVGEVPTLRSWKDI